MFEKKINPDYLKLAQVAYGGDYYLELKNYKLKKVVFNNSKIDVVVDSLLSKRGITDYYSYKNLNTGFAANLFKNKITGELVIAYRGTERPGLGENQNDVKSLMKDFMTDMNLVTCNFDEQFNDAWKFFKTVRKQHPKRKIVIVGQSLGGALAQIVAAKEYTINRKKVETYTFNAPGCSHLLDVCDCNPKLNYSFIINYSVMNDWCGMFGEHVGQRYLIIPIPLRDIVGEASSMEVLNNVLFTTHEGIFNYTEETMGKVIRKPKDFNQNEGLSLWFFDKNNPVNQSKCLSEFILLHFPQFKCLQLNEQSEPVEFKTENPTLNRVIENVQNSSVGVAIKNATDNLKQVQLAQKEKILGELNNTTVALAIRVIDSAMACLTKDDLEKANKFVARFKK